MTMPGYQTKLESIAIAGVNNLIVRSLLDRQQFHDPDGVAERRGIGSASWPLFGMLWPSSIELAAHMARRRVCPDERILEIGCGLGLASLVSQRRGARITASDCHPLAESFLDENARLNQLPLLTYRYGQWGSHAQTGEAETHDSVLSGCYDLIVGSDLLYERNIPEELAEFIDRHAAPDAEVWIVDPNRGHRTAFNRHMAFYGFILAEDLRLNTPGSQDESRAEAYKGRMLTYRRQSGRVDRVN